MTTLINLSPPIFPYPWASDWGEDRYGLWQAFTYNSVRLAFRWIPPGSFKMGSPETEQGRFECEDLHLVKLSQGFWLAETTVTQALWQTVMGTTPRFFKGENRPKVNVSWDDVQSFIKQLNHKLPHLITRLPWEAEWEYACRAGSQAPFNFSDELTLTKVNYRGIWNYQPDEWGEGTKRETADVKSYPCNAWGLYEMHGNVWEWCEDVWVEHLGFDSLTDPWQQLASDSDVVRVLRGGSWDADGVSARSASRGRHAPVDRFINFGFRLALEKPVPQAQPSPVRAPVAKTTPKKAPVEASKVTVEVPSAPEVSSAKAAPEKPEVVVVEPVTAPDISVKDRIGLTAGSIRQYLVDHGPTPVAKLVRELPEEAKFIHRSIGWLAQEGSITLDVIDRAETIALKDLRS